MLLHGISNVCFQILQDTEWPLFKNSTESWNDSYCACNLKRQVMNWVLYRDTWHWRKKEAMLNHKKLKIKIYFEVLCNCGKRLLRTIRTRRSTSMFIQIAQIIFGKPDWWPFIDCQTQRCKEYFYPVMVISLLEIELFSTIVSKDDLDTDWRLLSLELSDSKNKSLPFINHEMSFDESITEYFSRTFANRAIHYISE